MKILHIKNYNKSCKKDCNNPVLRKDLIYYILNKYLKIGSQFVISVRVYFVILK